MNSRKNTSGQHLLPSAKEAKRFLEHLVNLSPDGIEGFWRLFSDFFPEAAADSWDRLAENAWLDYAPEELLAKNAARSPEQIRSDKVDVLREFLLKMRNRLRGVWTIAEPLNKEWGILKLRVELGEMAARGSGIQTVGPPSPALDSALRHLSNNAALAKFCQNPNCGTPYFFASRRNQTYCSEPCAGVAQREYKQQWWVEHRDEMAKKRAAERKKAGKNKSRKRGRPASND